MNVYEVRLLRIQKEIARRYEMKNKGIKKPFGVEEMNTEMVGHVLKKSRRLHEKKIINLVLGKREVKRLCERRYEKNGTKTMQRIERLSEEPAPISSRLNVVVWSPTPFWVGSKWLLDFPRVPVTPGTHLRFFAMLPLNDRRRASHSFLKIGRLFSLARLRLFFSFDERSRSSQPWSHFSLLLRALEM